MAAALTGSYATADTADTEQRKKRVESAARRRRPSPSVSLWLCDKSGQQLFDHISMNVRQPEISSLETVGQFRVIESEQMQDGCVQVVDMRGVAGHVETELVGLAISGARFDAAAREPQ